MSAAILRLSELSKSFRSGREPVAAVRGVSLDIREGEFLSILGPSGCGKSTLLRLIAGLEQPDSGEIEIAGRRVSAPADRLHLPPEARNLGMVFQSHAIWPHMTVLGNVRFPLEARARALGLDRREIASRAERALGLVAMDELAARPGLELSGGQQQRVALARAIVTEPDLLLLDEPVSNLDAKLREQMRDLLKTLQSELGCCFVYVTHDQAEALSLSHRIAVMLDGEFRQIGTPETIYRAPTSRFVAEFVGRSNILDARGQGGPVLIRPEDIRFAAQPDGPGDWLPARVVAQDFLGDRRNVRVETERGPLLVSVPAGSAVAAGQEGFVLIDETASIRFQERG